MAEQVIRYEYTRGEGERFIISENGYEVSVLNEGGVLRHAAHSMPLPSDVIAAAVVDLGLAGWTPVE